MEYSLIWDKAVTQRFPSLAISLGTIQNINITKTNKEIKLLRENVIEEVRNKYNTESLKNDVIVRAYRDFFWSLGIDPTKTRPSGEALLRRILHGEELPNISVVVDAYNLASLQTIIPLSGFDLDKITWPLKIRLSKPEEEFLGIGMKTPIKLKENMLVLTDKNQILSIYPYRDADATKITTKTKNTLIIAYGAPHISKNQLSHAVRMALLYIQKVAGGQPEAPKVFTTS